MINTSVVEKIRPNYWRNSQLSIARRYGKIYIKGTLYIIDPATDYLVRQDVYKKEAKAKKQAEKEKIKEADKLQRRLF